ncbi:AAA family ATPase [Mycobacterium asiaticum]|uniref:AAA family ATPase n=1 Tax=Mycobacterium asiaticum TaxID=1790 RepID=A0A1A3BEE5_MYCAS|nr:AAA family ATPase [Mycobacterium asiaticum]OBI72713.1 hypothetical protein A9X01_07605 [Mycobacterium asiaticum]
MTPADAATVIAQIPMTANIYFGVNPTRGPARTNNGRGTEADVTRLAALWCDLDTKPGGCPSLDVAYAIIANLSIILGTRPSVIVRSGHGLHAYWPISDGHIRDGDITSGRALIRRWRRLVAAVADTLNVKVDNVYELARMMRVPGTFNNKNTDGQGPIPVITYGGAGGPLTMSEVDERLTEVGIYEQPGDGEASREEVSPPSGWKWAERTCRYAAKMIEGWAADAPKPGAARNPWYYGQHIRLFCARRHGCITEADYRRARQTLVDRHAHVVRTTEPRREPKRFEIADMIRYGTALAASKTDEQIRAELGGHTHEPGESANSRDPAGRRPHVTWANQIIPEPVVWAWCGNFGDDPRDSEQDSAGSLNDKPAESWNLAGGGVAGEESWESCWSGSFPSGRIAAGTIAIGAGTEGLGKSSFAVYLSAQVSTGKLPGAWVGVPRRVLYVAVEDSWKHTVVPRLIAAGADLTRIGRFDVITETDETMHLLLPFDNTLLEQTIVEHNVALVVLDPLMSLISDRIDTHRERDVRQALDPLVAIADRTGAVLYGVAHFNKGDGTDVSARITGSGAFKNVPRAVFGFARDPETGDCVITQSKNSLGRADLPSLRYRMESAEVDTPTGTAVTGRFVPLGLSDRSVADILAASGRGGDDRGEDGLNPAQRFIIGYLREHANDNADGEVYSRDVIDAGNKVGYSEKDLIKARSRIKDKIPTRRSRAGEENGWFWRLSQTASDQQDSKIPGEKDEKAAPDQQGSKIPEEDILRADRGSCWSEARRESATDGGPLEEPSEEPPANSQTCCACGNQLLTPCRLRSKSEQVVPGWFRGVVATLL